MKTPVPPTNPQHDPGKTTTPTGMLRHDHEVVLRALGLMERLAQGLEAGGPVDRTALTWVIDFFTTFVDRFHHGKEEQHLFPALERHGIPREGGPVGVMLYEHEESRGLLRAMTQGGDRAIAEAIRGYAALFRGHIDKEEGILFSIAEQVLTEGEQRGLVKAFEAIEQAVAAPGVHEQLLLEIGRLEAACAR